MLRKPCIFYGWMMVAIAVFGGMLIYGVRNSFSVFFPPILNEFGWQRGSTALMLSLSILIYGLMAPVSGSLGDRWKPRLVAVIGVSILGLATAACAFATELWHFYLFFGILAPIGTALCGAPMFAPAVPNWFIKWRGSAIALGQAGGSLSMVYGIFAEFVISLVGWRYAYVVIGGLIIAIMIPTYLILFFYRPEDKNKTLKPYGYAESIAQVQASTVIPNRGWTLSRAVRTYRLWLLVLSYFLFWGAGTYLVLAHQVKFAGDAGYSSLFAASIFGLFGVFMIVGQVTAAVSDWIGREITATIGTVLAVGALLVLISVGDASQPWLLYLYAVAFGWGVGLFLPAIITGLADIFHGKDFGAIQGLMIMGLGLGGAIGPWLGGYIYDTTGSYINAFVFSMVCMVLGLVCVWIAAPRKARGRGKG